MAKDASAFQNGSLLKFRAHQISKLNLSGSLYPTALPLPSSRCAGDKSKRDDEAVEFVTK